MTLLVGCLTCALALAFAGFTYDLADASSAKARSQLAADAAALAAVAESAPYGGGAPEIQARHAAEANGATLRECLCEPGATAMQVEVEVDGVIARARAVLDPHALRPLGVASGAGLHPRLHAAVQRLVAAARGQVHVVSGYRSAQRQAALWTEALSRYGSAEAADDWVAPPGRSMHERGLAVDLGGDLSLAATLVRDLGLPLHRPLPNEPWHFELLGSR